tara:strand:- start:2412 stop:2735 length:324 start_codon:yes stop_codon:yes gene_type:complete
MTMLMVPAHTAVKVYMPFGDVNRTSSVSSNGKYEYVDTVPWKGYVTKEDRFYEKGEVWDNVAVRNGREVPEWAAWNIREHGVTVVHMVNVSGTTCYMSVEDEYTKWV